MAGSQQTLQISHPSGAGCCPSTLLFPSGPKADLKGNMVIQNNGAQMMTEDIPKS